jgi:GMP synthase (glutamine-hydrolysing)
VRRVLVVKTGDAPPGTRARRGDFHQWIAAVAGLGEDDLQVAPVHEGATLPEPASVAGVFVTGSAAMVSDREPWSLRTRDWLAKAVASDTPIFAICYGHQILAEALGGRVERNPRGREIGTTVVRLLHEARGDPLFAGAPEHLHVHTTHLESVVALPPGARLLAENDVDPHHAFAYGPCAWGVQFHPEFDADVMRSYLEERRETLAAESLDPARLLAETRECPEAGDLLRRFAARVAAGQEADPRLGSRS